MSNFESNEKLQQVWHFKKALHLEQAQAVSKDTLGS